MGFGETGFRKAGGHQRADVVFTDCSATVHLGCRYAISSIYNQTRPHHSHMSLPRTMLYMAAGVNKYCFGPPERCCSECKAVNSTSPAL